MRPDPSGASSSRSQSLQGEAGSFGGARPKNASNQSLASTPASSSNPPLVLPFSPVYSPYQDDPFAPSPWGFYSPQTRNPEWDPLQFPCLEPIQETPPPPGEESVQLPGVGEAAETSLTLLRGAGLDLTVPQLGFEPGLVEVLLVNGHLTDSHTSQQLALNHADTTCRMDLAQWQEDAQRNYEQAIHVPKVNITLQFILYIQINHYLNFYIVSLSNLYLLPYNAYYIYQLLNNNKVVFYPFEITFIL